MNLDLATCDDLGSLKKQVATLTNLVSPLLAVSDCRKNLTASEIAEREGWTAMPVQLRHSPYPS